MTMHEPARSFSFWYNSMYMYNNIWDVEWQLVKWHFTNNTGIQHIKYYDLTFDSDHHDDEDDYDSNTNSNTNNNIIPSNATRTYNNNKK